jgi:hypothetical protein
MGKFLYGAIKDVPTHLVKVGQSNILKYTQTFRCRAPLTPFSPHLEHLSFTLSEPLKQARAPCHLHQQCRLCLLLLRIHPLDD